MDLALLVHLIEQDAAGVPAVDHDRDIGLDALRPFFEQAVAESGVSCLEIGDDLAHVCPFDLDDLLAVGQIAHEGRDVDGGHGWDTWFRSKHV